MKYFYLALSIAVAAAIFAFSMQPSYDSAKLSRPISEKVADKIIEDSGVTEDLQKAVVYSVTEDNVRNIAHMFLFTCLGFCFSMYIRNRGGKYGLAAVALICCAYGLFDEIKQHFVPGRDFSGIDVVMDCVGTFAGICAALVLGYIIDKRKRRVEDDNNEK